MASLLFCLSDLVELIGWNDVTMAFFVGALELSCLFFFFRSSGFGITGSLMISTKIALHRLSCLHIPYCILPQIAIFLPYRMPVTNRCPCHAGHRGVLYVRWNVHS